MICGKLKTFVDKFFFLKLINSTYAKCSNYLELNSILQKFYEMVCEILVLKTVREIFLIFCLSCFINSVARGIMRHFVLKLNITPERTGHNAYNCTRR